jgi:hypothetical protein
MTGFSAVLVAGFFNGAAYPFSVFAGDTRYLPIVKQFILQITITILASP